MTDEPEPPDPVTCACIVRWNAGNSEWVYDTCPWAYGRRDAAATGHVRAALRFVLAGYKCAATDDGTRRWAERRAAVERMIWTVR